MTEFRKGNEFKRVFLDTTPLIYFLDADEHFGEKTRQILEEILSDEGEVISSVITETEYLVYPYRTGNQEKVEAFFEFVDECGIDLYEIDVDIAKKAAQIRAEYKDFKAMDSLQLAVAVCSGCDTFLTNDKRLRQFRELKCITVEEWMV